LASTTSIRRDTEALALPEGRRVGGAGHEKARSYLLGRMSEIGLAPYAGDSFETAFESDKGSGVPTHFTNLIGVVPGRDRSLPPLLVGAHYDSAVDAPCVDDNAAAVAVALWLAQRFSAGELARDLIIALFDSEEPPYWSTTAMGSTDFVATHTPESGFGLALILDLIAHDVHAPDAMARMMFPEVVDLLFVTGAESDAALPDVVRAAVAAGERLVVVAAPTHYIGDTSDHGAFRAAGHPFLFLTCGRGPHYHKPSDTLSNANLDKAERVARFAAAALVAADRADLRDRGPADPVAFEAELIERAAGKRMPLLLKTLGVTRLDSREALKRFAEGLRNYLHL
jgi:hypothetical protein